MVICAQQANISHSSLLARRPEPLAIGVGIGKEHKGNGYAAEAVLLVMRFMFDERRFQKCEARVYDYSPHSERSRTS